MVREEVIRCSLSQIHQTGCRGIPGPARSPLFQPDAGSGITVALQIRTQNLQQNRLLRRTEILLPFVVGVFYVVVRQRAFEAGIPIESAESRDVPESVDRPDREILVAYFQEIRCRDGLLCLLR